MKRINLIIIVIGALVTLCVMASALNSTATIVAKKINEEKIETEMTCNTPTPTHPWVTEQEKKDYETTKVIMTNIFESRGYTITMTPTEAYCAVDARMTVSRNDVIVKQYTVEIKERITDYPNSDLALKVEKLNRINHETDKHEEALAVWLLNGKEYFITNLQKVDFKNVGYKIVPLKVNEYGNDRIEMTPIYVFNKEIRYKGLIPNGIHQ